jgi:hypothetical protein
MYDPGLVPGALPALGTAVLDELGNVWVSRFVLGHERWDERDAWHVLDRAGSPLGKLCTSLAARVADATAPDPMAARRRVAVATRRSANDGDGAVPPQPPAV